MIKQEQKQKAIRLYINKTLTIREISNLTNISEPQLTKIFRECFKTGELKPRSQNTALKPKPAKGQGKSKYTPSGIGKGGRNSERKKFTDEQEKEIALDYYERGFNCKEIKEKWGIHPMQMQRIRNTYGKKYAQKDDPRKKPVLQFDKNGNFIKEYESGYEASIETNICYSNILRCIAKTLKSAGGYVWKLKDTNDTVN